ncbi:MAG: hypothetical protein ABIS14_11305 [Sphingomonas sp.]
MTVFIEGVGWVSAALFLLSYILVSSGRLTGRSAGYQWLNVAGAAGFIVNGSAHQAWPPTVLNVIWLGIGFGTLWRIRRLRSATSAS